MAGFLTMTNLARIAKVVALLLFVLPWVTVSCADQTLVSMTGVDLATGHVTMNTAALGGGAPMTAPADHHGNLLVIVGAVLILAALAATFVLKGRTGALAGLAGSALAAVSLAYAVLVQVSKEAHSDPSVANAGGAGAGGPSPEQIAQMIKVNIEIGFYLCLAALAAAMVFNFLAMRGSSAPAAAAAPPPPTG